MPARLLLLLASLLALPAAATTLRPLTPAEVDALAHRIVEARVVAAHDVQVAGTELMAIEYELAVERVLKDDGSVAPQLSRRNGILVVRHVGRLEPGRSFGVIGMPRYVVGARYRLALHGESARGLTSPVGFGQGVARLGDDAPAQGAP